MATLTASLALSNVAPKLVHSGVTSISGSYSSTTAFSASGSSLIFLCKIPVNTTVLELIEHHTTGATTSPLNFGFRNGVSASFTCSAFMSGVTQGVINRATSIPGVPIELTGDESAGETFKYLVVSKDGGSVTTSLKIRYTLLYTRNPSGL